MNYDRSVLNIIANCLFLCTASFHTSTEANNRAQWNLVHDICIVSFIVLKSFVAGNRKFFRFLFHFLCFMPFVYMNMVEKEQFRSAVGNIYDKYQQQLNSTDEKVVLEAKRNIDEEMKEIRRNSYGALACMILETVPLMALFFPWTRTINSKGGVTCSSPSQVIRMNNKENNRNMREKRKDEIKVGDAWNSIPLKFTKSTTKPGKENIVEIIKRV